MGAVYRNGASSPPAFEDGFGQRHLVQRSADGECVVLAFRAQLAADQAFERALRERLERLEGFHSERYARVRGVEKSGASDAPLTLVSEHVPGIRVAEMLATAEGRLLPVPTDAALCLIRQLLHGVVALHERAGDLCHGAIAPERLIVTPHARLVIVEHVLGGAIEQLRYSGKRYWRDLRVALPRTAGSPAFDRRADVTGIGATALALLLGRPLTDEEYPGGLSDLVSGAWTISADAGMEPLPLALRTWLQRTLHVDTRAPFSSALEARAELDRVLHYSDPVGEVEALKAFLARYGDAAESNGTPSVASERRAPSPATESAETGTPRSSETVIDVQPLSPRPDAPEPLVTETTMEESVADTPDEALAAEPGRVSMSRSRLAAAAVVLMALTSAATLAGRSYLVPSPPADGMGRLLVDTTPSGALVSLDGQERGLSPLSLDLEPGRYTLKLALEGTLRSMPIRIAAGSQLSHVVELPPASDVLGQLHVRAEPEGARVTVDGHSYGPSPVTVEGLAPGPHMVLVENDLGSVSQQVRMQAGASISLVVPLVVPRDAPLSGWLAVDAPEEVQIFEGDRLLGSSRTERLMVSVGRHELRLVNDVYGYEELVAVQVAAGRVAEVGLDWPHGLLSLNAAPWAEVWVDGARVGETPLGEISVPAGAHEVVFRHPDLGERSVRALVTTAEPARVSVDLGSP